MEEQQNLDFTLEASAEEEGIKRAADAGWTGVVVTESWSRGNTHHREQDISITNISIISINSIIITRADNATTAEH